MFRVVCGAGAMLLLTAACDSDKEDKPKSSSTKSEHSDAGAADAEADKEPAIYALGSVVINPDNDDRTTYFQTIKSLDDGPFDNSQAIELPGNATVLARGKELFIGAAEEPTWVRYSLNKDGDLEETGRLSLLDTGAASVDYGNVIVDDETAVSVVGSSRSVVIWNPKEMEIVGEVDLGIEEKDGYDLETWTVSAHDGLVYVPVRWADWDGQRIFPAVTILVLDPHEKKVIGVAESDRCASGGRVVFAKDGYGYVMGDGRNYSIQMFANAMGKEPPSNCLLRMKAGETSFDPDFYVTVKSLTGGLESIDELSTAEDGSGIAFSKIFYPDELKDGIKPVDFAFWEERAHKMWSFELSDKPSAKEVDGIPFSALGFGGQPVGGKMYTGESLDSGKTSEVYETDPQANTAKKVFSQTGNFYGLYRLR